MTDHYEIRNAVSNSGREAWIVAAVRADGEWAHSQLFQSHSEAIAWCKASIHPMIDYSMR